MRRLPVIALRILAVVVLALPAALFAVVPNDEGSLTTTNYVINVNAAVDAYDAHVSGDLVSYTADVKIRYYDFFTGNDVQVPSPSGATDFLSDVSAGRIVFARNASGSSRIMLYDTADASTTEVDPQVAPLRINATIGGDTVAFIDLTSDPTGELYASLLGGSTSQITNDDRYDQFINVAPLGNVIVYESCATDPNDCDIRQAAWNSSTWVVTPLTNSAVPEAHPDTDGVVVVYDAQRSDVRDICWQPVGGGSEQCLEVPGYQRNPSVSDGLISFESVAVGESAADLFVYDIATNRLFHITSSNGIDETLNNVSALGDGRFHLAWSQGPSGDRDVRGAEFTLPAVGTFNFTGFLQPVDPYPTLNTMKAGAAVAVKFSLGGFQGLDIFAAGFPKSEPMGCSPAEDPVEQTVTAGGSSLQYDATSGVYTYVWKTEKGWAGSCRQLVIQFTDGSMAYANFKFK